MLGLQSGELTVEGGLSGIDQLLHTCDIADDALNTTTRGSDGATGWDRNAFGARMNRCADTVEDVGWMDTVGIMTFVILCDCSLDIDVMVD